MKCFVRHRSFGLGKAVEENQSIVVQFVTGEVFRFSCDAFAEGDLARTRLPLRTRCSAPDGMCSVEEVLAEPTRNRPARYRVLMDTGLRAEVTEELLSVIATETQVATNPLELLSGLDHGSYMLFAGRERLVDALARLYRSSGGLSSLHSVRIDLRPHQAFVAGVVLLDSRRRYLLADEVGLGKTIEAGIVAHDLLHRHASARVLVL